MNPPTTDKPNELSIDVSQWRRDIQTFANATGKALDAIAAELSSECSGGRMDADPDPTTDHSPRNVESILPRNSTVAFSTSNADSGGRDRLAALKLKLAQRISQSE